eukprot:10356411-Karenia_brevis.AAC.1
MLSIVLVDEVTDCMDVFELVCGARGAPHDKNQRVAVMSLREDCFRCNIKSSQQWPTACLLMV